MACIDAVFSREHAQDRPLGKPLAANDRLAAEDARVERDAL